MLPGAVSAYKPYPFPYVEAKVNVGEERFVLEGFGYVVDRYCIHTFLIAEKALRFNWHDSVVTIVGLVVVMIVVITQWALPKRPRRCRTTQKVLRWVIFRYAEGSEGCTA